jgi:hypothetical protein
MSMETQAPAAQKPTTSRKNRGRPPREVTAARAPAKPLEEVAVTVTEKVVATVVTEQPVERKGCKCPGCFHAVVPKITKVGKGFTYMSCPDCQSPFRVSHDAVPMVQLL